MSYTVERYRGGDGGPEGTVKSMTFTCDHPDGCATSPDDKEIIAAGGMVKMGWFCSGGRHYCPEHAEEARERNRA